MAPETLIWQTEFCRCGPVSREVTGLIWRMLETLDFPLGEEEEERGGGEGRRRGGEEKSKHLYREILRRLRRDKKRVREKEQRGERF